MESSLKMPCDFLDGKDLKWRLKLPLHCCTCFDWPSWVQQCIDIEGVHTNTLIDRSQAENAWHIYCLYKISELSNSVFCEKLFLLWKAWNLKVNSPSEIMYTDMSDHWHIYIETWKVVKKTSGAMHTALSNHWHFWIISELLLQDRLWEFKTELEIRCLRCLRIHRNKTMADHDHGHEEGKLLLKFKKSKSHFQNL